LPNNFTEAVIVRDYIVKLLKINTPSKRLGFSPEGLLFVRPESS